MERIGNIFNIIQGHQITDEVLYKTEGKIPVLTSRNEIKGYWNESIITEDQLPCITYPTKGNAGYAYVQTKIFDANNTAVLLLKKEWNGKINLNWFAIKLSHIFLQIPTSKDGVSYLNKDIVADFELEIPHISIQNREFEYLKDLEEKKEHLLKIVNRIDAILNKAIVYDQTPMEVLTEGYEKFIKGREIDNEGKKSFDKALKQAAKPKQRGAK